jgi:hypothetical protein
MSNNVVVGGNIRVQADWQSSGNWVDLSQWYVSFNSTVGFNGPRQLVANGGTCDIVVKNKDRRFTPNNSAGPYYPINPRGMIRVFTGSVQAPNYQFVGYIDDVIPEMSSYGTQFATIKCIDIIGRLKSTYLNTPLRFNNTADKLIAALVNASLNAPAVAGTYVFTAQPSNLETITITGADGNVRAYTWTTTNPATVANTIYLGASRLAAATNLASMMNATEGLNSTYGPTTQPYYLAATVADNTPSAGQTTVTVTSLILGGTGTAFTLADTSAGITSTSPAAGVDYPIGATAYDVGIQVFPVAGFNWQKNAVSALSAIQEIVESENGRFYVTKGGVVTFKNQQATFKQVAQTFVAGTAGYLPTGSKPADDVFSSVQVTVTPAQTLASGGVIAKSASAIQVPGSSSKTVHLLYTNSTTAKGSGGVPILPLVTTTDWVANTASDGSGQDYTTVVPGYVKFTYVPGGAGIDITITNLATGTLYLTTLQVRGSAVVTDNAVILEHANAIVPPPYGYNTMHVKATLSNNQLYADALSIYLLSKYQNPAFRCTALHYPPAVWNQYTGQYVPAMNGEAVNLDIDAMRLVSNDQAMVYNERYRVIGLSMSGDLENIQVDAVIERMDDVTYWLLGDAVYGVLGSTTRLAI